MGWGSVCRGEGMGMLFAFFLFFLSILFFPCLLFRVCVCVWICFLVICFFAFLKKERKRERERKEIKRMEERGIGGKKKKKERMGERKKEGKRGGKQQSSKQTPISRPHTLDIALLIIKQQRIKPHTEYVMLVLCTEEPNEPLPPRVEP